MSDQDYRSAISTCARAFVEAERKTAEFDATQKRDGAAQGYSLASRAYRSSSAILRTVTLLSKQFGL
jgi:hypothetical protein